MWLKELRIEEWFCHHQFLSGAARQNIALAQQSAWEDLSIHFLVLVFPPEILQGQCLRKNIDWDQQDTI